MHSKSEQMCNVWNHKTVVQNSEFIDCYGNSFQFMSVNLNWIDPSIPEFELEWQEKDFTKL